MEKDAKPRTVQGCPVLSRDVLQSLANMPAHSAYLPLREGDIIARIESDLELPPDVTPEILDGLLNKPDILLEDVIALLTGLPRNRDEEACAAYGPRDPFRETDNAVKRKHAAVWLFGRAAVEREPVAQGTRDHHERVVDIDPKEFKIPSCLGSEENSIAIDMARANDAYFDKWWRKPSTRWFEVEFKTPWLVSTLRSLLQENTAADGDVDDDEPQNDPGELPSVEMQAPSPSTRDVMDKRASVPAAAAAILAFRKDWPRGINRPKESEVRKTLTGKIGARVTSAVYRKAMKQLYGERGPGRPPDE